MTSNVPEINLVLLAALLPAILGLVNFLKTLGLAGRALTIVSMLIGVAMYTAATLLPVGVFSIAFNGIILGLAASGLFDLAAMLGKRSQTMIVTAGTPIETTEVVTPADK